MREAIIEAMLAGLRERLGDAITGVVPIDHKSFWVIGPDHNYHIVIVEAGA